MHRSVNEWTDDLGTVAEPGKWYVLSLLPGMVVITGGPYPDKTTALQALRSSGPDRA